VDQPSFFEEVMKMAELLKKTKYLTQSEFADYFRISESTAKNWRERGYVCYFQVPGSTRVLYPVEAIKEFERQHTKSAREVVPKAINGSEIERVKPVVSSSGDEDWRI
jgi:hypothetical protein